MRFGLAEIDQHEDSDGHSSDGCLSELGHDTWHKRELQPVQLSLRDAPSHVLEFGKSKPRTAAQATSTAAYWHRRSSLSDKLIWLRLETGFS